MGIIRSWQTGVTHYQKTGDVPHTHFWDKLENSYSKNPIRFERNHPAFAGLFEAPPKIGMLPDAPYWNNMRDRFELNEKRFTYYHPFQGKMLHREWLALRCKPGIIRCDHKPCDHKTVPEPSSIMLTACSLVVFLIKFVWNKHV